MCKVKNSNLLCTTSLMYYLHYDGGEPIHLPLEVSVLRDISLTFYVHEFSVDSEKIKPNHFCQHLLIDTFTHTKFAEIFHVIDT